MNAYSPSVVRLVLMVTVGMFPACSATFGAQEAAETTKPDASSTPTPDVPDLADAYTTPTRITALDDVASDDADPSLTSDRREIYFTSGRGGGNDIWKSTRPSVDAEWSPPIPVDELNTELSDHSPEVSLDGLSIIFATQRAGGAGKSDLWIASRDTRNAIWSDLQPLTILNSDSGEGDPTLTADGLLLVFNSQREGTSRLYFSSRESRTDVWSAPKPMPELDDDRGVSDAFLADEGLTIYFASRRPGGKGDRDIWRATRSSRAEPFSMITHIPELSSPGDDRDPWLSPDGRFMAISIADNGNQAMYESRR